MVEPLKDETGESCEPALHFHEFLFLLGLISYNSNNSSENIGAKMEDFYIQGLSFEKRHEPLKDLSYQDILDRVYGEDTGSRDGGSDEEEWDESVESDTEVKAGDRNAMHNKIEFRNRLDDQICIDWNDVLKVLNDEKLPPITKKPEVEQINPRPYAIPRQLFGKKMPKPEDAEDKKAAKKPQQKKQDKNAEPPIVYKWADGPPKYVKGTVHYMEEARQK